MCLSGEDHPNHGTGRGAPEIDIIEGLFQYDKFWGTNITSGSI